MAFQKFEPTTARLPGAGNAPGGDRRDGKVYVYDDEIVLAVNVALAIRRPLLISGPPGSGKSSLARYVANVMGWRYYEDVVTARTQARDLQWTFDAIRRLSNATASKDLGSGAYVEPGVLWWAFDREDARIRGASPDEQAQDGFTFASEPSQENDGRRAVVLIDEIDKADPDIPNSLLVALGSNEFRVIETAHLVEVKEDHEPFVMITTNDERELPQAFIRRCASLTLRLPTCTRLLEIAGNQYPDTSETLRAEIADLLGFTNDEETQRPAASTAEYLDAVRACDVLKVGAPSKEWNEIRSLVIDKRVGSTVDGQGAPSR
jgi:MoxR-like ATPase